MCWKYKKKLICSLNHEKYNFKLSISSHIPSYFRVVCWFVYSACRIYINVLIKTFMHYAHSKQKLLVYTAHKHTQYSQEYTELNLKRTRTSGCGLTTCHSWQGPARSFCVLINVPMGTIKSRKFLDQPTDHCLLKKNSAPWTVCKGSNF